MLPEHEYVDLNFRSETSFRRDIDQVVRAIKDRHGVLVERLRARAAVPTSYEAPELQVTVALTDQRKKKSPPLPVIQTKASESGQFDGGIQ